MMGRIHQSGRMTIEIGVLVKEHAWREGCRGPNSMEGNACTSTTTTRAAQFAGAALDMVAPCDSSRSGTQIESPKYLAAK